jgi:hypothetical protein
MTTDQPGDTPDSRSRSIEDVLSDEDRREIDQAHERHDAEEEPDDES